MASNQTPPPLGNFSYPPIEGSEFNYIDSFETSWVTPEFSSEPCFFSLYLLTESSSAWIKQLNVTVALNDTKVVSLDVVDSGYSGQLNLNYIDPLGGHKDILGKVFHVNRDPGQKKPMTWNQAVLSSSTAAASSQTMAPEILPKSTTASPASTDPSNMAAGTLIPSSTSTTVQSFVTASSSAPRAEIASITLGTMLGIVLAFVFVVFYIRRQRQKKLAKRITQESCIAPVPVLEIGRVAEEKDGESRSNEMESETGRWELSGTGRWELDTSSRPQEVHLKG